jgi:predicted HTH transcriptional regulator
MALTSEQLAEVAAELKQIATELNLSDEQKEKVKTALTNAREKILEYKQQNPGVTKEQIIAKIAANRSAIRERVVAFLTPDQLAKWDAAIAKLKDETGWKSASA